ncbi:MAG: nitrate/nitrite transporter NrtS [Leptolyngbyaceae cyanobacterium MO_188.B28]|nr:nitrate/nitrite transporter NrtS [Leptolyngbyaceae cyanobacterium MO_188.B28]
MQQHRKQSHPSESSLLNMSPAKQYCLKFINRELTPTAIKFALIVGSFISMTNYGSAILTGKMTRSAWMAVGLTYLIPYAVSIHGQSQDRPQNSYVDQDQLIRGSDLKASV